MSARNEEQLPWQMNAVDAIAANNAEASVDAPVNAALDVRVHFPFPFGSVKPRRFILSVTQFVA